ncbi:MAG: histidine kinase [Propionibacteriaceae bacterium]|jgi:signal transduction histidine kinase|nr:histidine kinase [Propionibacteriaceae bacterium]
MSEPRTSAKSVLTVLATAGRSVYQTLTEAAAGGQDRTGPPWLDFPPRAPVIWLKTVLWCVWLGGSLMSSWAIIDEIAPRSWPGAAMIAAGLLTAPVLLIGRRPLVAWRLQTLTWLLLAALPDSSPDWVWPPCPLIAYGVMITLLAARQTGSILIGVWLWSSVGLALIGRHTHPTLWASLALLMGVLMLVGHLWRQRARSNAALAETSSALALASAERDASEVERAVWEERTRIARDIHDVVAHHMSIIAIQAQAAPLRTPDLPPETVQTFALIEDTAKQALSQTRQIVGLLRGQATAERAPTPGLSAIADLVQTARSNGLKVIYEPVDLSDDEAPASLGLTAYRVVQEGLANVARHAPGAMVSLSLRRTSDQLEITLRNTPVVLR